MNYKSLHNIDPSRPESDLVVSEMHLNFILRGLKRIYNFQFQLLSSELKVNREFCCVDCQR